MPPHLKATLCIVRKPHGRHSLQTQKPKPAIIKPRIPHITRLMALAIRLDHLLATGQVKHQTQLAKGAGVTRARVSQILSLTNLAPNIQADLLALPKTDPTTKLTEHDVRKITAEPNWTKQRQAWAERLKECQKTPR